MATGLTVNIFQTTQMNGMRLGFIPKIIIVTLVMTIAMPWMMNRRSISRLVSSI